MFSSVRNSAPKARDDWQTPDVVIEAVLKVGNIELDPCTSYENPTGADRVFTIAENGLEMPWDVAEDAVCYVNPPYSNVALWARRAACGWAGSTILLIPARTDTRYWFDSVWSFASMICFWKGRLKFKGGDSCAPFPSALALYTENERAAERFFHAFEDHGWVVTP